MELFLSVVAFFVVFILMLCVYKVAVVLFVNGRTLRKADRFGDIDLCCCGSMLDQHSAYDNHQFKSEVDYFLECNLKKFS